MDSDAFFQIIRSNPRPLIVDVWAPWCAPCRRMNPIFEELKEAYDGRVDVLKVNADESQPLVKQLGVLGIPTTLVFRGGEEIGRRTGAMSRKDLESLFEVALSETTVRIPAMSRQTRIIRLFITAALAGMGLALKPGWLFFIFGGIMLFWAVYDFIPGVTDFRDTLVSGKKRTADTGLMAVSSWGH